MTSMQVDGGWGDEVGCVVLDLGSDTLKVMLRGKKKQISKYLDVE